LRNDIGYSLDLVLDRMGYRENGLVGIGMVALFFGLCMYTLGNQGTAKSFVSMITSIIIALSLRLSILEALAMTKTSLTGLASER